MTVLSEIIDKDNYVQILDHGFVGLIDSMGDDQAIVDGARLSYGAGTKQVSNNRSLIRYLIKHKHTSPIELGELKFHIKVPIFVMRQLVRHRTASVNEYSARYSIMPEEYYIPELNHIMPQSTTNNQGRGGEIDDISKNGIQWLFKAASDHSHQLYQTLITSAAEKDTIDPIYDVYGDDALLTEDFPGLTRELARCVLPVNGYTELVWKQDLKNLLHLIRLRTDNHAQYEIRVLAGAIYNFVRIKFPLVCEAFEDYEINAVNVSRMEKNLLQDLLNYNGTIQDAWKHISINDVATEYGLSKREVTEFKQTWGISV